MHFPVRCVAISLDACHRNKAEGAALLPAVQFGWANLIDVIHLEDPCLSSIQVDQIRSMARHQVAEGTVVRVWGKEEGANDHN